MPPKRKLVNSRGPTSKRTTNIESTILEEASTTAIAQGLPQPLLSTSQVPIVYDLLAQLLLNNRKNHKAVQLPLQNNYSHLRKQLSSNLSATQLLLELPSQ